MDDFQLHLEALDAESAHHIRDSASRAGLQAHDPAARMIAEMWVAVAALKQERQLLSEEMADHVDDEAQQEVYLNTAMRYLIECENEGYFMQEDGLMRLNENVELDILRDREDFVELISRVDATSA